MSTTVMPAADLSFWHQQTKIASMVPGFSSAESLSKGMGRLNTNLNHAEANRALNFHELEAPTAATQANYAFNYHELHPHGAAAKRVGLPFSYFDSEAPGAMQMTGPLSPFASLETTAAMPKKVGPLQNLGGVPAPALPNVMYAGDLERQFLSSSTVTSGSPAMWKKKVSQQSTPVKSPTTAGVAVDRPHGPFGTPFPPPACPTDFFPPPGLDLPRRFDQRAVCPNPLSLEEAGRTAAAFLQKQQHEIQPKRQQQQRVSPSPFGSDSFASAGTLTELLRMLAGEDEETILIVRRINRLGLKSSQTLKTHLERFGAVQHVFLEKAADRTGSRQQKPQVQRPSSLGFVQMASPEAVKRVLAQGPQQVIEGVIVRVQEFKHCAPRAAAPVATAAPTGINHAVAQAGVHAKSEWEQDSTHSNASTSVPCEVFSF